MQQLSQTIPICLLLLSCLSGYGRATATPMASRKSAAATAAATGGFSIRLIHRDSVHSPLYPGKLTAYERLLRQVKHAKAYIQRIHFRAARNAGELPDELAPIVTHEDGVFQYMVETYVGSKEVFQYLMIDTGSDLVWIQCEPYEGSHFKQDPPHYVMGHSTTMSLVPCSDKIMCLPSYPCDNTRKLCVVMESYIDGAWIRGVLSRENFAFENDMGNTTTIANVTFGCINTAREDMFGSPKIAGMAGMGRGHQSLATQLAFDRGQGMQFTHCFIPSPAKTVSFLRFGQDFTINDTHPQSLKFMWNPWHTSYYYLNLTRLSCYIHDLKTPKNAFAVGKDGYGGCFIDSGASMSYLIKPAYNVLKTYLLNYFRTSSVERVVGGPADLCYKVMAGPMKPLPSMDYHFGEEAHMRVHPDKLWIWYLVRGESFFCLGVLPDDKFTVIGANHQTNMRFIYDLKADTLSFGNEDCRNDE